MIVSVTCKRNTVACQMSDEGNIKLGDIDAKILTMTRRDDALLSSTAVGLIIYAY